MKIEKEDIISNEAIRNVTRLSYEITKLDDLLMALCLKYGINQKHVLNELKELNERVRRYEEIK